MSHNVFILGAGFSYDANVPLLGSFADRMFDFAIIKKQLNGNPLNSSDIVIFEKALAIRNNLNSYHGRALFDDRNIEDILSLLTFNALTDPTAQKDIDAFTIAITRTIELSCLVTHPGVTSSMYTHFAGNEIYREFWAQLLKSSLSDMEPPVIITFNYDLVLERSLFQLLESYHYDGIGRLSPFDTFSFNYSYPHIKKEVYYLSNEQLLTGANRGNGKKIRIVDKVEHKHCNFNILKLHGSINFPRPDDKTDYSKTSVTACLDNPYILPPVFNKYNSEHFSGPWKFAFDALREAKYITICGYSMPKTDVYLQYFIRAATGPNTNLSRISVFDPVLYLNDSRNKILRRQYRSCFSQCPPAARRTAGQ
jgi:hypothetical protein